MWLLAITVDDALITYGPLGIGVLVLGVFAAQSFRREIARSDKAEAQRDAMVEDVFTRVLPSLARNTEAWEKRQDLDREVIEALKENADALRALRPPPERWGRS